MRLRNPVEDNLDLDRLFMAESSGRPGQTSSAGAYGLAQFLPSTWKGLRKDTEITGVKFPKQLEGKGFKEVMDNEKFAKSQEHLITTLHEHIMAIHERLSQEENIFRDTLIGNLEDLCDLIPKMNIANDQAINALAAEAKAKLCSWAPATLRDDTKKRADVADEADKILTGMKGLI